MDLATGQNLIKQKKFPLALELLKNLLILKPNNYDIYFYLGRAYSELQDYQNGIKFYNKYLEINKNSINCLLNLAILYLNIGDKKNSEKYFKKIIKLNKNYIYAYYGLFTLSRNLLKDRDIDYLREILTNKKIGFEDKSLINYIFSKVESENNNIDKEIFFLKEYHKNSFESNSAYNRQSQYYYEKLLGKINKNFNFQNKNNNFKKIKPIFIVGLPRSGSTLIESLLSSGDQKIKTYGESNFFNIAILEQIKNTIFDRNFNIENDVIDLDLSLIKKSINERYDLKDMTDNKNLFLDKSLENVFNIEIILKIFPNAKFIHTKRNINDSILSIYFSMLPELSWTHSLTSIKKYVQDYQTTISRFKKSFPNKIIDVSLDEFTANTAEFSKEIFEFCDLIWNRKVLDFYKRKDLFSKTLSSFQIRREINKKNQSNYEKYYFLLD